MWPPHPNGASLPSADAKDTDPNCPKGGRMWRWTVLPPRPDEPGDPGGVYALEVLLRAMGGETSPEDAVAHIAGEIGVAQQARDGRDFWSSDATRGAWWMATCLG